MTLLLAATAGNEASLVAEALGWGWSILCVGLGLGFVIFVHELGHFLVAKACGVKCEKFYVGFDVPMPKVFGLQIPSKLCHFQWGETEYGVGILPLGGYVKMLGQDDDPRNAEKEAARTRLSDDSTNPDAKPVLDPRSLTAKSVPARAAIFAAGVTMNLIFGVLMAAVAYGFGVPEVPAVIGGTVPGGAAWKEDLPIGGQVLQFGRDGKPYDYLRFEDLMHEVIFNGVDKPLPMLVRAPNGRESWFEPQPKVKADGMTGSLGIAIPRGREIGLRDASWPHLGPKTDVPFEKGDVVIAVDGQKIAAGHELNEVLARRPTGPLTFTVERKIETTDSTGKKVESTKEVPVVVQPKPLRELGLVMKIGPIVAIRKNSPAADAGFQVGDVLDSVSGQPVGDPLSLGQRLTPVSEPAPPIEFTVTRTDSAGKKTTKTLSATPVLPRQYVGGWAAVGPAAIESLGIAYEVTPVVAEVIPGSPAAKAGLAAGDAITAAQFIAASDQARAEAEKFFEDKELFEPIVLDPAANGWNSARNWNSVFFHLQDARPDTRLKLTWLRGGKSQSAEIAPVVSDSFYAEDRGVALLALQSPHQARSISEALYLGYREMVERLKQVLRVLSGLLTRKISPTNLQGPLGIIGTAGAVASQGVPILLIFLAMLSANLVVLNLLPIPALDGGHLLFLAAEAIRGKPVDERLQMKLTIAGVLCLLSLMIFATAMDLNRWLL
ncbi:MAG: site-2 protease family protein [Pirellulaceae bacterium]|nr:site-2 protease family protein [Pirellulaceae bacterium]